MTSRNYCYFTIDEISTKDTIVSQHACYADFFRWTDKLLSGENKFNICYAIITLNKGDLLTEKDKRNWINYLKRTFGGIVSINKEIIKVGEFFYPKNIKELPCLIVKIDPYKIKEVKTSGNRYLIYKALLTLLRYTYEDNFPSLLKQLLTNYKKRSKLLKDFSRIDLLINIHRLKKLIIHSNYNHSIFSTNYTPKFSTNYLKLNINNLIVNKYSIYISGNYKETRPHVNISIEKASEYITDIKLIKALDRFYNKFKVQKI